MPTNPIRFAEFFSGIGLIRKGLERTGFKCVFANDIDLDKNIIYKRNFGSHELVEGDVVKLQGLNIPAIDIATASFPCQDVSLAGNRNGLKGARTGTYLEFERILSELASVGRAPKAVLLENVTGLLTSHNGQDIRRVLKGLNVLGYNCDIFIVDAVHFLPQSRPRVFVFGMTGNDLVSQIDQIHPCRPSSIQKVIQANSDLRWLYLKLPALPQKHQVTIKSILEEGEHLKWLTTLELEREKGYIRHRSLQRLQIATIKAKSLGQSVYLTAYRRMRNGLVCLETRDDGIAGCLRSAGGGSSRQILIEVKSNESIQMRYFTAREYGRLQGVEDSFWIPERQTLGLSVFGDGVAIPVIEWVGEVLKQQFITTRIPKNLVTHKSQAILV